MAKVGLPRTPTVFSCAPAHTPPTTHHPTGAQPTLASCLPRITGFTRLALGHQLKYPFHSQKLGEQEGTLSESCQGRPGSWQTWPYTPFPTNTLGKSLLDGEPWCGLLKFSGKL